MLLNLTSAIVLPLICELSSDGSGSVQIDQGLSDAVPVFMRFFSETTSDVSASIAERVAALKCLQAWIAWGLTGKYVNSHMYNSSLTFAPSDLTSVVPTLISLLSHPDLFVEASDVLQDILTSSALAQGYGPKTLTEPILQWINIAGTSIAQRSLQRLSPAVSAGPYSPIICSGEQRHTRNCPLQAASCTWRTFQSVVCDPTRHPTRPNLHESPSGLHWFPGVLRHR